MMWFRKREIHVRIDYDIVRCVFTDDGSYIRNTTISYHR